MLIERGLQEPPAPGEPGQFALGEPDRIEGLVRAAGFDEIAVGAVEVEFRFASWEEYRRIMTSLAASLRATLETLDDGTRADVDDAARERLAGFLTSEGYVLPGVALVTKAG